MRKGLFLTRHHGEISNVVNVDGLANEYSDLTVVRVYDHFFGKAEQRDMLKLVKEHQLDAVVLAGHSANLFETGKEGKSFVNALKFQGVNQNRIVFTNLYEQVALIHSDQPGNSTQKARLLINTALAKAQYCHKVDTVAVHSKRAVLVLGTTWTGLAAAGELLAKNYAVYMIDNQNSWRTGKQEKESYTPLVEMLEADNHAELFFESGIVDISGWYGDYDVVLKTPQGNREISVGGILLCVENNIEWIVQLQPILRLDTDKDGFLVNIDGKRSTGRTKDPGILFVASVNSDEQLASDKAEVRKAVLSLTALLDKSQINHPVLVSEVDESVCSACGTCIKTCAFSASGIDTKRKISIIDPKRCKGCGNCVTSCPTSARDLVTFPSRYVNRAIEILSQGASANGEPKVLAFLCKNSGYLAADAAGAYANPLSGGNYSPNVMPLRIECGGNIDTVYILKALKEGFDGIAFVVCKDNHCHNLVGNTDMERRIGLLRAVLRSRRIDDNRMRIIHTYGNEGKRLNSELKAFSEELKQINRQ